MHPNDAVALDLDDGDLVCVTSTAGSIHVPVQLTEDVRRGVVSYPFGYGHAAGWRYANQLGGANVNVLTPNDLDSKDPLSGASWLDGIPVSCRRAETAGGLSIADA
jgi:anaerobic selenocysteine-containing dehydrogenase